MSATSDYYELLGLKRSYRIDGEELQQAYISKQREFHPDRAGRDEKERIIAMQHSADVNAAYHTLRNPVARAEYLLSLHNIPVGGETDTVKPSQSLLKEAMDHREALMEAESLEQVETLRKKKNAKYLSAQKQFAEQFDDNQLNQAVQTALALRYYQKFLDEVKRKEKQLRGFA
jgi:molecular chaperone HscB